MGAHVRLLPLLTVVITLSLLGSKSESTLWAASHQVLYLTQSAGFAHPVLDHSEDALERIAEESGLFELTVSRDASILTAETLAKYNAIIFFTTGELPMSVDQQAALLAYVRGGRGFVGVHSATDTFYEWPGYLALIGGYFDGHPWRQEVTVRVEKQKHPSTMHLGESFRIDDEIYQFRDWSRSNVDVLLSLDVASVDLTAPGIKRTDQDFALAWTRHEGRGRVFYTALGHRPEVWDDTRFQRHLVEGITWAMGNTRIAENNAAPNTLTAEEVASGWQLLFDGQNLSAWRGFKQDEIPGGWRAVDGTLARVGPAGDIITIETFDHFEMKFDWRLQESGNSGVMFRVSETGERVWHSGPEFQVLHNEGHADGLAPITSAGSNYALHPPIRDGTRPIGSWNTSRLLVLGSHVEHWMNGIKLLEYELGDVDWTRRVEASKFASLPRYGRELIGHIAIQDHSDPVAYRNLKIRRLKAP